MSITKSQILKHLESLPMDAEITIYAEPQDYEKAKQTAPFQDSLELALSGESIKDNKSICFRALYEPK